MVENEPGPGMRMTAESSSPEETRLIARALGSACRGGEVLLLFGDLGAGKTCFVQGLAIGLGIDPGTRVTSPTFTIHAEYSGRVVLNHLDLYRLEDPVSLEGLGVGDMLADSGAVAAVEWPEMVAGGVGGERLEIRIVDLGDGRRSLEFSAYGRAHAALLGEAAGG